MSAKYKSPSFLLPNELNTSTNTANDTGINSLYSMDFNAPNSAYLDLGIITEINGLSNFTFSLWIKPVSPLGGVQGIVFGNRNSSDGFKGIAFALDGQYLTGTSNVYFEGNVLTIPAGTFTFNQWSHVVITYNNATLAIYVDNSLINSLSLANFSLTSTAAFNISRDVGVPVGKFFNGQIDEFAIFNRTLDASERAALYDGTGSNIRPSNLMATNLNPLAYYPLGEQAQNSGKLPNASGSEWQFPNGVLQDYVMDFNGTNYITMGKPDSLNVVPGTNPFSISGWFNSTATGAIFAYKEDGTNTNCRIKIGLVSTGGGNIEARIGGTGNATSTVGSLADGNWHHFLAAVSTTEVKLYIDGDSSPSTATPGTGVGDSDASIGARTINSTGTEGFKFTGKLSNIVFWNTDQSTNLANIYNNGSPQTTYTVTPQDWWKLNSNSIYTPSAPNYTKALDFGGVNSEYISLPNSTDFIYGNNDFSISLWFYKDISSATTLFSKGSSGNGKHLLLFFYNATNLRADFYNSASSGNFSHNFINNQWYHIVLTRTSSGNVTLYVNGETGETITPNYANGSIEAASPQIGKYYPVGQQMVWDGFMSNFAIYNSIITATQVSTLFNFGTPETNISFSPTNYYKLDNTTTGVNNTGSLGSTYDGTVVGTSIVQATTSVAVVPSWKIPDASGTANGVSTTLPSTALQQSDLQSDSPFSNFSLSFDGASYVSATPLTTSLANSFTFSVWFKSTSNNSTNRQIIDTFDNYLSPIRILLNNNKIKIQSQWTSSGSAVEGNIELLNTAVVGQWYHVVAVYDSSTSVMKGYLDGVLNSSTFTVIGDKISTNILSFGRNEDLSSEYFIGSIDETSIFNYTLTDAQVLEIYNSGRPKDLSSFSGTAPTNWWRLGEDAFFAGNVFTTPNSISGAPNGTGPGTVVNMISADAPGTFANGIGTNLDIEDRKGDAALSTSNSQSYNMIPSDISPYVPEYIGKQISNVFSMNFDGVDDRITISAPDDLSISGDLTMSMWFKADSFSDNEYILRLTSKASEGQDRMLGFSIYNGSYRLSGNTYQSFGRGNAALSTNVWYHAAVVYSSGSFVLYLNGQADSLSIAVIMNTITPATYVTTTIGKSYNTGFFDGSISNVAIFNSALTAGQIYNDIYQPTATGINKTADLENNPNLPNPVAWYRMGDN